MILPLILITCTLLGLGRCQEDPDGYYNRKYEPYSTLIAEQKYLRGYANNYAWSTKEQNKMPSTKLIGVKLMVTNWDVKGLRQPEKNETLSEKVNDLLNKEMKEVSSKVKFDGYHKIVSMQVVDSSLRVGFYIASNGDGDYEALEEHLSVKLAARNLTYFQISRGMHQLLSPVMRDTVIEIFLQLYKVKPEYGMDDPKSIKRQNMTDQMMHLIGTRFKNQFGEFFYRIVIMDFIPSRNSMIVRSAVLLDPNRDNLYHATNIWQSLLGYIKLGPFPLLPENIRMINSFMVLSKFSKYLDDRSYKRPLSQEFGDSPFILITIPSFFVVGSIILTVIIILRLIHFCIISQTEGGWEPLE